MAELQYATGVADISIVIGSSIFGAVKMEW
jgi:hypothetical protein